MRKNYFIVYFAPFLIIFLIEILIGRSWYSYPNDNTSSTFGLGLNIATLTPHFSYHHPGITIVEIAGILSALFQDSEDLTGFFAAGFAINVAFALGSAWWVACLAHYLGLRLRVVLILALMVVSMPAVALYAPLYGTYGPTCFLLPPMGLGMAALLGHDRPPLWVARSTLLGLGFLAGNFFPTLILPITLFAGFVFLVVRDGVSILQQQLGPYLLSSPWRQPAFLFLSFLVIQNVLHAIQILVEPSTGHAARVIVAIAIALALYALVRRVDVIAEFAYRLVLPVLCGWAVACNVFILHWGVNAGYAMKWPASPKLDLSASELIARMDILGFFTSWYWHLFLVAVILASVLVWFLKPGSSGGRFRVVTIAAGCSILLALALVRELDLILPRVGVEGFGLESRRLLATIAPVAMVITALSAHSRRMEFAVLLTSLTICGLSLADYAQAASTVPPRYEAAERDLAAVIDRHLSADPDNRVICVRAGQPAPCAVLYGFNNYRLRGSLEKLSRTTLRDNRISYVDGPEDLPPILANRSLPGEVLLIIEDHVPLPQNVQATVVSAPATALAGHRAVKVDSGEQQ